MYRDKIGNRDYTVNCCTLGNLRLRESLPSDQPASIQSNELGRFPVTRTNEELCRCLDVKIVHHIRRVYGLGTIIVLVECSRA